ncbi:MAG: alkaline phosphatase family protein [Peptococcaceae bacterium]
MMRQASADKIFVLGIDGMDPRLTRKFVDEGKMPNTKKLMEMGSCREDLVMLGAQPTVTPPMWTTMATGAYPNTHGITCFFRQSKEHLHYKEYNLDSRNCQAEQLWNVFAEAGKKTLVWQWPGSSWPPSSQNPNLHVVDGTQPAAVNMGSATVDMDFVLSANVKTPEVTFRAKAASDENVPCVLTDVKAASDEETPAVEKENVTEGLSPAEKLSVTEGYPKIILKPEDGEGQLSDAPFDVVVSPIKDAHGWVDAPADAKEFTMLLAKGLIRRPGLILKNEQGVYDHVAIYKNKKAEEPIVVLENDVFTSDIIDEGMKGDEKVLACRSMRLLDIAEDGTSLKIWVSGGLDISNDTLWHPHSLFETVTENAGYPRLFAILGGANKNLLQKCMLPSWDNSLDWNARALNYLMENEGYDVVFSQVHNVDLEGHIVVKFMKGTDKMTVEDYAEIIEQMYTQTDRYIGEYMHLLDKGWTILLVSDHGQVCPEHKPPMMSDMAGVNIRLMQELGFTEMIKDENGEDTYEIDWSKTKALQSRGNHIYINLKGRDEFGIVDPADKYELEEEIMTALYGYKDPETGKRVIALALRNKDAVLLGMGGPECGDILIWLAEGYNYDHCDSLSTTYGFGGTSVSPIFIGAGPGLKQGFYTDRVIRQVDLAPTIAVLGGVRMPAQCEGAPVYQILTEQY